MNDILNTDEISAERLAKWRRRMASAHATPILLMGLGQDHKAGEITICTPGEMDPATLAMLLREAIDQLVQHVAQLRERERKDHE